MPQPLVSVSVLLNAKKIAVQVQRAVKELHRELGGRDYSRGLAYEACTNWQARFEHALRSDLPDWNTLAGFRLLPDFVVPLEALNDLSKLAKIFPPKPNPLLQADFPSILETPEHCWRAFHQYFDENRILHSGKPSLKGAAEAHFLSQLKTLPSVLGGQAGNIAWLWRCIGANFIAYVPYAAKMLADLCRKAPELGEVQCLQIGVGGAELNPLSDWKTEHGVPIEPGGGKAGAPSGASIIMFKDRKRVIFQFAGFRDYSQAGGGKASWEQVEFYYQGSRIGKPLPRAAGDTTWPVLPFFCETRIVEDKGGRVLRVDLCDDAHVKAIAAKAEFAVLGGIDALFYDNWLIRDKALQGKLVRAARRQLGVLAENGVRIGVEISGFPKRDYALLLQELCRQSVIVAIGINGVDELPSVVGERMAAENGLDRFQLKHAGAHADLQDEIKAYDKAKPNPHFEYVTFLRARHLARLFEVRTLYVHTMTLDFILRKGADPGSLLRAQQGSMMAKGFLIAALLRRTHGKAWAKQLKNMVPAVNPKAMVKLGRFAAHFAFYEGRPEVKDRLLHHGFWLAPSAKEYSLAVAPVMWPHEEHLAKDFNATGSGDMTFGAFFFLGGV